MARHQTSQPRHNIVMRTDQVSTFNRTNSSVCGMVLLSLPAKYATEVFHNPPRSLGAGLGWWRPGLSSGCDWSHPCRHWLLIGCCTSDHSPAIRCSESRTPITAEWKYTKAAKKNITIKSKSNEGYKDTNQYPSTHSTFLLPFRTW